jgi:TIR domain-containing protein
MAASEVDHCLCAASIARSCRRCSWARQAEASGSLRGTQLRDCNFAGAIFAETVLSDLDLSICKGLELIKHQGPSPIDIRTLQRSGPLPLVFLRGVGLPDKLIEYLPSLLNQSIQLYSCFISYSAKDEEFVGRLHADLQDNGVRCWFAPEDMKIGAKILDTLDQAIRLRDKILLVLSEASIASAWVEDEVTKGFAEERQRGGVVLFPVRLDEAVFATNEAWARKLRDNRNIGDFRH